MTPSVIREKVVSERIKWIREMVAGVKSLPQGDFETFRSDPRNVAAAESYLRRGLEALLDLGRHILAKGFGTAVPEYKEIARELEKLSILSENTASKLRILAGFRNRMVHFYHEITHEELYKISTQELRDIEDVLEEFLTWINQHPGMIDKTL
jgi:uncharacterized protein YutE (UPF0331/DUF86 family)